MQNHQQLVVQYLHILQKIDKKIDRKEFCQIHQISQSKLFRILSGQIQADFELLNYMCMYCGLTINLKAY